METILIGKYKVIQALKDLCKSYECFIYTIKGRVDKDDWDEYDCMMGPAWIEATRYLKELTKEEED